MNIDNKTIRVALKQIDQGLTTPSKHLTNHSRQNTQAQSKLYAWY